ncbi:MAG: hypothetical protein ACR2NP_20900 [Pirellulaceae bacterium]
MSRRQLALVVPSLLVLLAASAAPAQLAEPSDDVLTVQGLQQRRLFELAISHARAKLSENSDATRANIELVVAMLETMTAQAMQTPAARRDAAWQAVRNEADTMNRQFAAAPRGLLIEIQRILIDQAQVEQLRQEIEAEMAPVAARDQALQLARVNIQQLTEVQDKLSQLMNRRNRSDDDPESFSSRELLALRYNVEYQLARALLHRGMLFGPDEQLNRTDTLELVEQQMSSVLQSVGPEEPLWWMVQSDRIAAARMTRNFARAAGIISTLPKEGGTPAARDQLNAELVRLLLVQRRLDDAVQLAGRNAFASQSPQLDLARIELYTAMAGKESGAGWQQRALELTKDIENVHGGYWARRASLLVVGTAAETTGSNLDLLIRTADEFQRKQQWDEAVAALDQAAEQADPDSQADLAWKLGFRAAAIQQQQQQHVDAANRFESLAGTFGNLPDAHTAQLMACWNLARTIGDDQQVFERYAKMLQQLIDNWPDTSSADQARIWLGLVQENRKNWPAAIGLYLNVASTSPHFGSAVGHLQRIMTGWLQGEPGDSASAKAIAQTVVESLSPLLKDEQDWATDPTVVQRVAVLLSELHLVYGAELDLDVETILSDVISSAGEDTELLQSARALQIVAASARSGDISQLLNNIQPGARQLDILLQARARNSPRRLNAVSFARTADRLKDRIEQLPDAEQKRWQNEQSLAMQEQGNVAGSLQLLREQAVRFPNDSDVQLRLANALVTAANQDASLVEEALVQWRRIAQRSRKNSEDWFAAKYHVSSLLARQGNSDDALQLLRYIRAVPPGWHNSSLKSEFDELYRSLGGQ